ncbi:MAG: Rrf2 family transcriptional regulator [Chloroflexota bacterium]
MRFSAKTTYALLALIDMATHAETAPGGRLTTRDIALRQGIPERFLEQQITTLKNAGLVHSQRGASGGCTLAQRPDQISVLDVIVALEGTPLAAEEHTATPAGQALDEVWDRARTALVTLFRSATLADLVRREGELREQASQMFYL